jgi:hypothetical protein
LECIAAHVPHVPPENAAPHVQLHPVVWSPLTVIALPPQSAALEHVTPQTG